MYPVIIAEDGLSPAVVPHYHFSAMERFPLLFDAGADMVISRIKAGGKGD
jgi:hypothetical protein